MANGHAINNSNIIKQICMAPLGRTSEALVPGSVLVSRGKREPGRRGKWEIDECVYFSGSIAVQA